jgi:hypothetical protein
VRDVWQISGCLEFSGTGELQQIVVNQAAPLAAGLVNALRGLLAAEGIVITLGEI